MMKKTFSILAIALALAACGSKEKKDAGQEEAAPTLQQVTLTRQQMSAVGIKTGKMEQRQLGQTIRVSGQLALDPASRAEVSSLIGGVVRAISTHEGNRVAAGQTVAYIENTEVMEMQRSYLSALNALTSARQERERQHLLAAQNAGVKKTLQQADNDYAAASAQVAALSQQLAQLGISAKAVGEGRLTTRIPVKAPITGIVGKVSVSIGSYVDMQTPLMTVVDNTKLHVDLRVFEKDLAHLQVGQTVDLRLTNSPEVRLQGKITDINSAFDDDSKALKVHASLPQKPSAHLMPDMFVTGLINVGEHLTQAMPDESIVSRGGKKYIFMQTGTSAEGTNFRAVEVTTGVSELGYTQVTLMENVSPDALFVTRNAFYISSMLDGESEEE